MTFFDWVVYEERNFEFVRVSIIGSKKYPIIGSQHFNLSPINALSPPS